MPFMAQRHEVDPRMDAVRPLIPTDVTLEEITRIVRPGSFDRIHEIFYELGAIPLGERLEFSNPPIKHERGGKVSGFVYPYQKDHGDNELLVSWGQSTKRSLPHFHLHPDGVTDVREIYRWVDGKARLNMEGDEVELSEENPVAIVPPGVKHQLSTDTFSLNVIEMVNATKIPEGARHRGPKEVSISKELCKAIGFDFRDDVKWAIGEVVEEREFNEPLYQYDEQSHIFIFEGSLSNQYIEAFILPPHSEVNQRRGKKFGKYLVIRGSMGMDINGKSEEVRGGSAAYIPSDQHKIYTNDNSALVISRAIVGPPIRRELYSPRW